MAITKGAEKRHHQSEKRKIRNRIAKSEVRTIVKRFLVLVQEGNREEAERVFNQVKKCLDTVHRRGILHQNTVARKKSRLAKRLNRLAV